MHACLDMVFPDGRRCPVRIGAGVRSELPGLWQPGWREAALIGDATVMGLHGEALAALLRPRLQRLLLLDFPAGEAHKTRQTKAALEDRLLEAGLGRDCCLVALGGGISLDLVGFVAATYLRGVAHLNLPTSLLAQVDAALGGKTAVNTPAGKNLIGAFHQPAAVLVDSELLLTLPVPEWRNGLAELTKHAVIADPALFAWLEAGAGALSEPGSLPSYPLQRCLELKAAVVAADEREQGLRAILNFGHSIGHALEHARPEAFPHGAAVAVGMLVEARLATRRCGFPLEELGRLEQLLAGLGLPSRRPPLPFQELQVFLGLDKKRAEGELRLPLPARIGSLLEEPHSFPTTMDELARAWEETPCSA